MLDAYCSIDATDDIRKTKEGRNVCTQPISLYLDPEINTQQMTKQMRFCNVHGDPFGDTL